MTEAERAILNAVTFLRTQPDCKTAADLLMRKLSTEKLLVEVSHAHTAIPASIIIP